MSERRGFFGPEKLPSLRSPVSEGNENSRSPENAFNEPFSAPPIVENLKKQKIFTFDPIQIPTSDASDNESGVSSLEKVTPRTFEAPNSDTNNSQDYGFNYRGGWFFFKLLGKFLGNSSDKNLLNCISFSYIIWVNR